MICTIMFNLLERKYRALVRKIFWAVMPVDSEIKFIKFQHANTQMRIDSNLTKFQ